MRWESTQAGNSTAKWNALDAYSRLLVDERHFGQDGEEFTLPYIQARIDGVCIWYTRKAGLLSNLQDVIKEDTVNSFSSLLFKIAHAEPPNDIPHKIRIVIMKCGL